MQALLFLCKTGCLKSEAQVPVFRGESRECFLEINIDNQSKIIIVYSLQKEWVDLPKDLKI